MRKLIKSLLATSTMVLATINSAYADTQTGITNVGLAPIAKGIYFSNWDGMFGKQGDHNPGSAHISENANVYFIFDLSFITAAGIDLNNVSKASLVLSSGTTYTPTDDFYLSLYDVSTSVAELTAPQKDRADIFEDLQSGVMFGSIKLPYDFQHWGEYDISLNQDGLNAIKSSSGLFVVGASFNQWLQMDLSTAYMYPDNGAWGLSLQFTTPVPEPETYGMLLAGIGLITIAKRRRN
jgi:hypothetical protein